MGVEACGFRPKQGGSRAARSAPRHGRLDGRDVDLVHRHHGFEGTPGLLAPRGYRLGQHARRDLPGKAPPVLAPAAGILCAAIADDGVPVAVGLFLVVGRDLERKGRGLRVRRAAVEAEARDARDGELHGQYVAGLAGRVIGGRAMDGRHPAVGEGRGVEAGGLLGVLVEPEADRVLVHGLSFRVEAVCAGQPLTPARRVAGSPT